jgi:transcription termination/antitermination protein NusG
MSVQEPQDQFERESVEDEIEESQDSLDETPLTDSDSDTSLSDSESVDVPASTDEAEAAPEDSTPVEESDELDVPAIESMPVSSSEALPAPEPTEGPAWYVIHCYSGYENKVRHNLEQRIETMGMKDKIFDVVIPTQEEIEVKDGKRRTVERHIFPGYVLVNMALTEESWYVVRNTPGVTGFVGMGNNPTPLRPEEVAQIVKRMEAEAPTVKVTFKVGERVRIIDGPFNDFRGVVSEIDMERTKVRVMVSFFGRETPVELDFLQVEKA